MGVAKDNQALIGFWSQALALSEEDEKEERRNGPDSWIGSGLAISKGTRIVRPMILLVLLLLLAKILFGF